MADEPDLQTNGTRLIRSKDTKEIRKLLTSSGPLMVIVYAKWCGHCQSMFETWKELASKVNGKANVYIIEADDYTDKDISGYPSMRIVKRGRSKDYDGGRSAQELTSALLGNTFGGKRSKRSRTGRLIRRVRKISHRTLRRNMSLV
jgi:thiol-disulfide isomerase/thioredoxin